MPKKPIQRPFTLAAGIILIVIVLFDFTDTFDLETFFTPAKILMLVAGFVLILFAFAKSDRF